MIPITEFISFIIHIDKYLSTIIQTYNLWTYLILFIIVFFETGIVLTPILPGDSLIFAAGSFAGLGSLSVSILFIVFLLAAVLGDTLNYTIGYHLGPKVFKQEKSKFFKKEYLSRTKEFYDKHGKKTIILARFIPIIRTFAPFVAGIGKMDYGTFIKYNILGAVAWVGLFTLGGYFFGTLPIVQKNFSIIILTIIFLSFIPVFTELYKHRNQKTKIEKNSKIYFSKTNSK